MARVQEGTAGRALQKAVRAPRAGAAHTAEEGALFRARPRRHRGGRGDLSDSRHPERSHYPVWHRVHGAGIVVRRANARLAGAEAARAVSSAREAMEAAAALGEDRGLDSLERPRGLRWLRRVPAHRRLVAVHGLMASARRQLAGGMPNSRLNARLNAPSES